MNVGTLIDSDPTEEVSTFKPGDLMTMNLYHGEHKFLVLGGMVRDNAKEKYFSLYKSGEEVVMGFEPNHPTFMKLYIIEPDKLQKVGSI